jgi:FtsP/CotA-like multicopper oxidase with cupredoxin domain
VVQDALSLSSQNGLLALALTMRNGVDSLGFAHYCYDYTSSAGMIEAPTLRLNPGDTLTIDFTNQLNATPPTAANNKFAATAHMGHSHAKASTSTNPCVDTFEDLNTTNIHFHGLNVPPVCHGDDVLTTLIQPGPTPFQYSIQIPTNEPPGLYWYHPHPHGYSALQVNGGAAGAIIINGIEKVKPQVSGLKERVFVIRQQFLNFAAWVPGPYQLTLNYEPALYPVSPSPIIEMAPGEKQFWRVANSTTQAFLSLSMLFGSTPQNLEIISLDGVPVTNDPFVTSINIPPAGRAEFIVTAPPAGQAATFVNNGFNTGPVGNANAVQLLANISTSSSSSVNQSVSRQAAQIVPTAPVVASAAKVTQRFAGLETIKATTQRKLYFSEAPLGSNPPVSFFITVDGQIPKLFSIDEPPAIVTKVGAVEDWTIENHTSEEHAFHMHQIHFLVLSVNGVPLATPVLQDTYNMPFWPGTGPYPSITVRMDFRDPNIAGTFVYHCHVLDHEDAGMMAKIEVDP